MTTTFDREKAQEGMAEIAKAAANAIAVAWCTTRPPAEPRKHFKEIVINLDNLGDPNYVKDIASAAGYAIEMQPPIDLQRLPIHHYLGAQMGEQKSDHGPVWVRWRVYYNGSRQKMEGCIDWGGDLETSEPAQSAPAAR